MIPTQFGVSFAPKFDLNQVGSLGQNSVCSDRIHALQVTCLLINSEGRGIIMAIRREDIAEIKNPRPAIGCWPKMRWKFF